MQAFKTGNWVDTLGVSKQRGPTEAEVKKSFFVQFIWKEKGNYAGSESHSHTN